MAMVGSLAALPIVEVDQTTGLPLQRRSSNTAEDAVHKRASLVLQMADSLVSSNNRRRRQLEQIESGKTDHVQQVIDDIMHEKPANLMDLLREVEPEALPSREELKERYSSHSKKKMGSEKDTTKDGSSTKEDKEPDFDADTEDEHNDDEDDDDEDNDDEDESESVHKDLDEFHKTQDMIVAETTEELSHTAPLQEQLKRSYAAIVKLRENSDLRYEALEKKYNELKRAQNNNTNADASSMSRASPMSDASSAPTPATESEQLAQAYGAIVRLRENSDLRYNVLESKYLDLKRSHVEADARNERLEAEIETMRVRAELVRVTNLNNERMNNSMSNLNDSTRSLSQMFLPSSSSASSPPRRGSSPAILATSNRHHKKMLNDTKKVKALQLSNNAQKREHAAYRKKVQKEKEKERMLRMTVCKEFVALCERVEKCKPCQNNVSQLALLNVKDQIEKLEAENEAAGQEAATNMMEDMSFREDEEVDADSERDDDDDDDDEDDEEDNSEEEDETATFSDSVRRHDGAMALLGANWEKLAEIEDHDEPNFDKPRGGRFGNLSESKTEQKLRGKKSRFVAAQSGVYCRIDHDMQNQYGNFDKFEAPSPTPRSPPVPPPHSSSQARYSPPNLTALAEENVLQAPPALKRPVPPSTGMQIHQGPAPLSPYNNINNNMLRNTSSPPPPAVLGAPKSAMKNSSGVVPPHPPLLNPSQAAFQTSPTSVFVSDFAPSAVVDGKPAPPFGPLAHSVGPARDPPAARGAVDVAVDVDGLEGETPTRSNFRPATTATSPPPSPPTPEKRGSIQWPLNTSSAMMDADELAGTAQGPSKPALRSLKKKKSSDKRLNVSFSSIISASQEHKKFPVEEDEPVEADTAKDDAPKDLMKAPAAPGESLTDYTGSLTSGESKPIQGDLDDSFSIETENTERMSGSKKVPRAKLDPAEKKAKREAALREAKMAAKMVRKNQRGSSKKLLGADGEGSSKNGEESSVISGISNASSLTSSNSKQKTGGFFKNPFRKKNTALEAATARAAGIPTEIQSGIAAPVPTRTAMKDLSARSDTSINSSSRMSAGVLARAEDNLTPNQKALLSRKAEAARIRAGKVKEAAANTPALTPLVSAGESVEC